MMKLGTWAAGVLAAMTFVACSDSAEAPAQDSNDVHCWRKWHIAELTKYLTTKGDP